MAKRWKKEEVAYLKRYAKARRLEELARRFRTEIPVVEAKLDELGLAAKDSANAGAPDPLIETFEQGLRGLYKGQWKSAAKLFEKVIAESDTPELVDRARQFLVACETKGGTDEEGAEDPFLEAVYEKNRGNLEEALSLCSRGGRQSKDERFAYLAASIHALEGTLDEAARFLSLAIEMDPKNRVHAFFDPDFQELRNDPEHAELFAPR